MQAFKPLVVFAVKELFLRQKKKDVKELVLERLAEDSKELGLAFFVINLSTITFILSFLCVLIYSFHKVGLDIPNSIAYAGAFLVILSTISILSCFFFLKRKVSIYKNMSEIKQSVNSFSWLSPLVNQLNLEQQKMKNNLRVIQHRETNK